MVVLHAGSEQTLAGPSPDSVCSDTLLIGGRSGGVRMDAELPSGICPTMKRPFFSTLRGRLLVLVMLALLPAAGLIVYSGIEQRQDANAKVREDAGTLAEVGVAEQEQLIEGSRQLLVSLALLTSAIDLSAVEPSTCGTGLLGGLLQQFSSYSNVGIALPNGTSSAAAFSRRRLSTPQTGPGSSARPRRGTSPLATTRSAA